MSILHNIVHLLFGIAGAMARTAAQACTYLVFGGAIYLVLFVYGSSSARNRRPTSFVNTADDFVHLILGIGMIGLGLTLTRIVGGWRRHSLRRRGCDDQRYEKDRSTTNHRSMAGLGVRPGPPSAR